MTYPKAYEGVKKLVAAEALQIISAGLGIIVAILGMAALAGATAALEGSESGLVGAAASGIGVVICTIGIVVLSVISEIFMLIGLKKASEDEPKNFKIAFIGAIAVLIASVLAGVLSAVPIVGSALKALANFATIAVFLYTIYGIKELATALNRPDINSLGNTIVIIEVAQLIIACIATFVGGIFAVISAILTLVGYIIYLVYLTKAKKMLEEG